MTDATTTWIDVFNNAKKAEVGRLFKMHWREQLEKQVFPDDIPTHLKEILEALTDNRRKAKVFFITVNFEIFPSMSNPEAIPQLVKVLYRIIHKKWVTECAFVWEFTAHHHFHILIERGDKVPSEMIRELKNTVKDYCNVNNPHCFNIKALPDDEEVYIQKLEYLEGFKIPEKAEERKKSDAYLEGLNKSLSLKKPIPIGIQFIGTRFANLLVETRTNASEDSDTEDSEVETLKEPAGLNQYCEKHNANIQKEVQEEDDEEEEDEDSDQSDEESSDECDTSGEEEP